jgi:hypothetical protein
MTLTKKELKIAEDFQFFDKYGHLPFEKKKRTRKEKLEWYKKEFEKINSDIVNKESLSYFDFLRIRNFKLQNSSIEDEEHIKAITEKAFKFAKEGKIKEAIKILLGLNGVAIPIASTILAMRFPDKYAIIDRRVIKQLGKNEWLKKYLSSPEIYEEYILLMRKTKPSGMPLRDYERSLFEKE